MSDPSKARAFVVLGASGGIGEVLSQGLTDSGARLLIAGRDASRLEALASRTGAETHTLDARDPEQVADCVQHAVTAFGRLDGIANCVGSLLLKPAHLTSPQEWNDVLSTNLGSAFNVLRAATRAMREEGGSIVLVSSAAARIGLANHEAIAAAKAGIAGLTLAAAASYASWGIRVNAVAPGLVRTPLTSRITSSEAALASAVKLHALGRIGEPSEVAGAIEWLLRPEQSWITGQVLGVDGGLGTVRSRG